MNDNKIELPGDFAKSDPEKDDRLRRSGFCKTLARVLANGHPTGSTVLAIYGNWGVGKTTVKNFTLHYLRTNHGITPIEFEPWQWSGSDRVISALFSAIEISLGKQDLKTAEKRFKTLARVLGVTVPILDFGRLVLPSVAVIVAALLILFGIPIIISAHWLAAAMVGVALLLALARGVHAIASTLRDYYIELRETRNATLDEARDGLINDLKERETPLVIVIDDIDRLEAAEIRQVIQTVKAVSNLPNVVFLLLFQREVVESALEEIAGEGKGGQFLAKAILAGFHVPEPPPGRIVEMLDERIAQFRKAPDFSLHWDDPRWQQSVKPALMPFFRTARDVIRFSATLQVYIEQHRQNNMLEVNPIDLTALETIRMFEPDMFERLAQIPVVEPSQIIPSMDTDEELEKKAELELSELVGFASTARKEYTSKLLGCLFPRFGARIASKVIEESPEWDRELRICHPLYYSRYFDLALTANRVTDREFQIIIKDSANIEKLNADLGELNNGKILPDFMARFFPHLSEIPASNVPVFIRAISEAGESLPDLYEDSEGRGSKDNAGALIYQALRNLPEAGQRREALRTLLEQSPSLDIGIHLVATIESTVKKNDPSNPPILSASDVAELVAIALRRIRNEAKTGVLMTRPWLTRHLYRWSEWASPSETKAWLAGYLTDPAKARAFINRWTSRIIRSGTPNEFIPCLDGEGLDRLVGFDLLDQILAKPGGDEPMSSDEAMALKLYERAKELKASGHPSTVVNFKGV